MSAYPIKPKQILFLGDLLKCLREFPENVRHDIGYQLDKVQHGELPDNYEPMPSIAKGVEEVRVRDTIADTPEQAANLRARAELMRQITAIIKANDWKQAETAIHCKVTKPRINDLLHGRVFRFSLDVLVNIATALGQRVHIALEAA